MCGRTKLSLDKEQLRCACSYKERNTNKRIKPEYLSEYNNGKEYIPSYNIAPTDVTPVLMSNSKFKNAGTTNRILKPMMWGIIPPWHKGDYRNHKLSTNNCRLENIRNSKLYNPILRNGGRCVIVVEGFYEWQTTNKSKQPYYIYKSRQPSTKVDDPKSWDNDYNEEEGWRGIDLLNLAGLYHTWQDNNTIIHSYSVITMESNETLSWLHHRMPAILDNEEQIQSWLDTENVNADLAIEKLKPTKILQWHPVTTEVNNSKYKASDCNKRIELACKANKTQSSITTWFTKSSKRKTGEDAQHNCKKAKIE